MGMIAAACIIGGIIFARAKAPVIDAFGRLSEGGAIDPRPLLRVR